MPVPTETDPRATRKRIIRLEACSVNGLPGVRPRYEDGTVGPCNTEALQEGVQSAVSNIENPLAAIGKLIGALMDPVTWIRAGELIVGLALILMGLKQFLTVLGVPVPGLGAIPSLKALGK